ncbi:Thymidine kinase [compost metagenome]
MIAYGLKTDFRGELFPGSYHLLCLADKFEELKSICWCGNKAHMNSRVNEAGQVMRDGEQVEIGGNDRYVSLCRKHYLEGRAYR